MNASPHPSTRGTILIVDDNPANLRLLSQMLSQHGYEIRSAISASAAFMAIGTGLPDLILLDINMPQMGGYEICQQLKAEAQTREIPVIFLSALSEVADKVKAFQVGGVDYITKPFQVEEVLVRVENQLTLRRMQAELQQAKAEALKALAQEKELNRLKSEFVSMVSHDFRTPLTSIQAYAELLRYGQQKLDAEVRDRYFDQIDGAIEHLLRLLDEVLLIGSFETGKVQSQPTFLDLEKFCWDLVGTLQLRTQQPEIVFKCEADGHPVVADPTLLHRLLTNLLSNAIKYSPNGGIVDFTLQCQDAIVFRIQDQGIGIPLASQAYLFDTFYRCPNVGQIQGTGLGLSVVKRCVDALGGNIQIESTEGQGTTVIVTLPRTKISPSNVLG